MRRRVKRRPRSTTWANYLLHDEAAAVDAAFEIAGFNFAGRGQNQGLVFVRFKDWSVRKRADLKVQAVLARTAKHFASYQDATIVPINPPSIPALGTASGFDFELEDRAGLGHEKLMQARDQLLAKARQDPNLALVRPNGLNDNPTYKIDIDREKASAFGINLSDVDQTFSIAWGSRYVNNFLDTDGRIKKVYVQADAPFRMNPEDLSSLYVRNSNGNMVPFTSFASGSWSLRLTEAGALQRRFVGGDPGTGGARQEHRPGDGGHAEARAAASDGNRL